MSVTHIPAFLRRLWQNRSGLALIEFAYTAPFLAILIGGGVELANYSITHMRVSQIAVSLADNASRAKEQVAAGMPPIREVDINEIFNASSQQAGGLDIQQNGRLILTSLEVNSDGGQWLHWQRCFGDANYDSSYGNEGDGASGTAISAIGPAGRQVFTEDGEAVMFVEVVYDYQPLMFGQWVPDPTIRKTAAMYVRDSRDLSGVANASGAQASTCS